MTDLFGGWSCHVLAAPDAEAAVALRDGVLSDFHLDRAPGLDALADIPTATRRSPPLRRRPARASSTSRSGRAALRALLAQLLAERQRQTI